MLEAYVHEALRRARIRPSRARGQHFLIDDGVLARVIQAARLDGSEVVVEIGPGLGTLTQALARRCSRLHAFELDDSICAYLRNWVLPEAPNVVLHDVAFNKYVFEPVLAEAKAAGRPLKVVTNLPYQISSAFLHTVADYSDSIALTVVMLQREVAQRVTAQPGDEGYGSFSIYLQNYLHAQWVCDVPAGSFYPPPKVESAVISLAPRADAQPADPEAREQYLQLVQRIFKNRRKQILNGLQLAFPHLGPERSSAALSAAGIDPQTRPQDLLPADFMRLAREIWPTEGY